MFSQERKPNTERVGFELRATGIKLEEGNPMRSGIHTRGYLPHIKREGARYFTTFRLADSLPKEFLLKCQADRAQRLQRYEAGFQASKKLGTQHRSQDDPQRIERDYYRKIEQYMDRGRGECWLRRPDIADLTAGAICFFEEERYILDEWVVMPNHVHVVFWPMPNFTFSEIVQSWKRFTSREANKILNRTGQSFWQPESYDHWIRDDDELARCCRYVVNNPVKAGLCAAPEDWKWSSAWRGPKP